MDAVARRAAVSKATLYAHFASKDALFAIMMGECTVAQMLGENLAARPCTDLRATLEALGRQVTRFLLAEERLAVFRIAIAESARFPELGQAFYRSGPLPALQRMRDWLAVQQAAGLVRDADLDVAAQQLFALVRSSLFLRASLALPPPPTEAEIDASVAAAVDTWLRAYAA
jgi:AcrR family transcriptional regulator